MLRTVIWVILYVWIANAWAIEEVYRFEDQASAARFDYLTHNLKCAVCQSQALAESDVLIAKDMKNLIRDMIRRGESNDDIRHYLVSRYGKDILLSPPIDRETWLLWLGPILLMGITVAVGGRYMKRFVSVS